jgi:tRNA(Ile)-lysidine synthase
MIERFLTKLKIWLPDRQKKLLLTLSGGVDSMVMADLMLKSDYNFEVAHCNFQLRGQDSEDDMGFVQKWCEDKGIVFHCRRFDTSAIAHEHGISIQMAARELRYNWFQDVLKERNLDYVVTAHHADDHVETILLNLVRGTGLDGLKGIRPLRGKRLRPLLDFNKIEILNYAHINGVSWREDVSNKKDDYSRNFLRHRVIPLLKELNPSLNEGFERFGQRMEQLSDYVEKQMQQFFSVHVKEEAGFLKLEREIFFSENHRALITRFLENHGFSLETVSEILNQKSFRSSGTMFENGKYQLLFDRHEIFIRPFIEPQRFCINLDLSQNTLVFPDNVVLQWEQYVGYPDEVVLRNPQHAFIDMDKVCGELYIRTVEKGDKMIPFGMKGHKLISDMLTDQKVSVFEKQKQCVLCDSEKIIWLVGRRVSNEAAILSQTSQILHFFIA